MKTGLSLLRITFATCAVCTFLFACQLGILQADSVNPGDTQAHVQKLLGEPARTQRFSMPEPPFWGPQESLTDLIPAGTQVEEWVYVQGKEELYIWFACDSETLTGECSVIKTARYPVGAVY